MWLIVGFGLNSLLLFKVMVKVNRLGDEKKFGFERFVDMMNSRFFIGCEQEIESFFKGFVYRFEIYLISA